MPDKKALSERDICIRFITPALETSGWDKLTLVLEEVSFTDGKIYATILSESLILLNELKGGIQ